LRAKGGEQQVQAAPCHRGYGPTLIAALHTIGADATGRRVSRVATTRKGVRQLDVYRTRRTEWLADRLRSLNDDERTRLEAALDVLEKIIEVPAVAQTVPLAAPPATCHRRSRHQRRT